MTERQNDLETKLSESRQRLSEEFQPVWDRYEMKVAALKLALLVPLLLLAVWLFVRMRGGTYAPLAYAFGAAVAIKVVQVMHEYFPTKYFKYILILLAIAVAVRILVYLLRMVAAPKRDWLLKQYREAYEVFLCPVCAYPIRRGPFKYSYWTRRSIKKLARRLPPSVDSDELYTCPVCSTALYEKCPQCHGVRHSLLPACEKCGAIKEET